MKNCENCGAEHDGSYASGRFCSKRCGFSFSTKAKRKEISLKVSKKLKKNEPFEINCSYCGNLFVTRKKTQKLCSLKCMNKFRSESVRFREKLSESMTKRILAGKVRTSLRSIKCFYEFDGKQIQCDSKVEYSCLDYFTRNFKVLSIKRFDFSLKFEHDGILRNYIPDFLIETEDRIFAVECKAQIGKNANVSRKWSYYYDTIESKKKALEKFCEEKGYVSFFYTKDLNYHFYHSCNCKPAVP